MLTFITDATTSQLEFIATQCQSLEEINTIVGRDQKDFLIANTFYRNHFQSKRLSSIWIGLNEALDLSSAAIDLFWVTVAFVTLGAAAIWLAGITALLTLGLLSFGVYGYYKNNQTHVNKTKEEIQLTIIKIQAFDALIKRNKPAGWVEPEKILEPSAKMHFSKKESMGIGIGASVLLVTTFYWGIMDTSVMLGLLSATSLLAGPVGFGIAAAIGLVMGVMIAVKHYQSKKANESLAHSKNQLHTELNDKAIQLDMFKQFKQHQKVSHLDEQKQTNDIIPIASIKRSVSQRFFVNKEVKRAESLDTLVVGMRFPY